MEEVSFWLELDGFVGTLLEYDVGIINVRVVEVGAIIGVGGLLGLASISMMMGLGTGVWFLGGFGVEETGGVGFGSSAD
jgi:hypothetical protein